LDTTHRKPVGPIVVVGRVHVARIEVQVVTVRGIVRTATPIVAVVANVVERARPGIEVAGSGED